MHRASCHIAFEDAQKFGLETHHCLRRLKHQMQESMNQYEVASDGPNKAHLGGLIRYSSYWKGLFPREACFGCLQVSLDIILPCRHALCELCYRNNGSPLGSQSQLSYCGTISCTECLFCGVRWNSFEVILPPPTAGARVLSLDGGGIRGICQLIVLQELQKTIDLPIPFYCLFDQMLGTSIGDLAFLFPSLSQNTFGC